MELLTHGPINLCVNEKTESQWLPVLSVLELHCTPSKTNKNHNAALSDWLGLSFITFCEPHWLPWPVVWWCELCCLHTTPQAVLLFCLMSSLCEAHTPRIMPNKHRRHDSTVESCRRCERTRQSRESWPSLQFPVLLSYWCWWQVTIWWRHCWKSCQYRSKFT